MIVLAALGRAAQGENALSPLKLELYPTWHAVGLEICYAGDGDADGRASFVWKRPAEATWHNGVDLTRDADRRFWWGSIFPLEPGEAVEVKATFEDPDGTARESLSAGTTTRVMATEPAGGRQIVVSPDGRGAIRRAARGLKPGDVVRVRSGTYLESIELGPEVSGVPGRPIVFVGVGPTQPVIDSSVAVQKGSVWAKVGQGIFSRSAKGAATLVVQDGRRMYGYTSLDDLRADRYGARRAFFHDAEANTLFLKTGTGKPPREHVYRIGVDAHGFDLKGCSHVVIRNLHIRHTARAAVRISGGDGNAIIGNTVTNCGTAVWVVDSGCDNTAIWDNTFRMTGQTDFTWRAGMREHWTFSRDAICAWTGRGTSIVGNTIDGYHNLIALEPPPGRPREEASTGIAANRDLDVMYNELLNSSDDAIEADYGGVNMRIYSNRVRNANSGVSVAPCVRGPVYVLRNDFTFRTLMFKFGIGSGTSHGACYCDHNSGYGLTMGSGLGIYFNKDLPTTRKHFGNNVMVVPGTDAVLAMRGGNVLDGNCYWRPGGETPVKFQWLGRWLHGLLAFQAASGMEARGLIADPLLLSTPGVASYAVSDYTQNTAGGAGVVLRSDRSDFRLQPGSPCIDRGILIRGVNEDFLGRAPDIGVAEHGSDRPWPYRPQKVAEATPRRKPSPVRPASLRTTDEHRGPTDEEKAAAENRYIELRRAIIEAVASGRRERVFVDVGGISVRAVPIAADEELLVVKASGIKVPLKWSQLSPKRFYRMARRYADDHEALYEYCVGNGLVSEAQEEAARR